MEHGKSVISLLPTKALLWLNSKSVTFFISTNIVKSSFPFDAKINAVKNP